MKNNKNNDKISYINNFVHPFNQFNKIDTTYNKYGEVTVNINKTYSQEEITYINKEVDKIIRAIQNGKKAYGYYWEYDRDLYNFYDEIKLY